jgi:hypothetical protein
MPASRVGAEGDGGLTAPQMDEDEVGSIRRWRFVGRSSRPSFVPFNFTRGWSQPISDVGSVFTQKSDNSSSRSDTGSSRAHRVLPLLCTPSSAVLRSKSRDWVRTMYSRSDAFRVRTERISAACTDPRHASWSSRYPVAGMAKIHGVAGAISSRRGTLHMLQNLYNNLYLPVFLGLGRPDNFYLPAACYSEDALDSREPRPCGCSANMGYKRLHWCQCC